MVENAHDRVLIGELQLIQVGLGHGGVADPQTEVMGCLLQGSCCGVLEQEFCQGQAAVDHQSGGGVNEAAAEHLAHQFPGGLWAR